MGAKCTYLTILGVIQGIYTKGLGNLKEHLSILLCIPLKHIFIFPFLKYEFLKSKEDALYTFCLSQVTCPKVSHTINNC